ncbi:glycogen synthase [Patescibacteria group bacterium]|nr:glycogen synthase [Patescibacteria group bacterium]
MKVLFIASECAPIAKVGGLADVVGSLPKSLKKLEVDISVLIPFYGAIKLKKEEIKLVLKEAAVFFDGKKEKFNLWQTTLPKSKVPVFLIENNKYFKGNVYIETDASSGGSATEAKRFFFLSKVGIKLAETLKIDILHCHDWHTAIIPFLIKKEKLQLKNLLTIHNLQYQGLYPYQIVNQLLNTKFIKDVNCLKQGILNARIITTVSPTYAKEILTKEYGAGLEPVLLKRKEDLHGILNGIDKINYSLDKKQADKRKLQKICKLAQNPKVPVIALIGRLTEQKGFDILNPILDELGKMDLQLIVLAAGYPKYEKELIRAEKKFPDKLSINIKFDAKLAQQIYAGADMFLMPSQFEPCGLGQMIAMSYGTVPIVRAVGGLKDTVTEETGFLFKNYDAQELLQLIKKALGVYENKKTWKQVQINGIKQDFSWDKSAKRYLEIYQKL